MPSAIVSTPGSATANSYTSLAEAVTYFDDRLALTPAWDDADTDTQTRALLMATRTLDALFSGHRTLRVDQNGVKYLYVSRKWKGTPATSTQRLAWPRAGLTDRNGNAIADTVIPRELKDAECEFAGQLLKGDRTLDNSVVAQGVTMVKAGSVEVSFKDDFVVQVVPDAVLNLLPDWWYDPEQIDPAIGAEFNVIAEPCYGRSPIATRWWD